MYEQLADAYAHAKDKVYIAKVDADGVGKPLGSKYGVTGFPSTCHCHFRRDSKLIISVPLALKWFAADGTAEPFEGARDLEALAGLCVLSPKL